MGGARVGLAVGWSCRLALLVLASVLPCLSLHAPPRADEGTAPVAPSRRSCAGHRTEVLPLAGVPRRHGVLAQRLRGGLVGGHAAPQPVTAGCKAGDDAQDSEPQEEGKWRPMCRICYDEEPEGLFTPCKCSGSMRYVHKECLRHWRAVNVRERAYTHCPMCAFEYKLSDSASSAPPDTWTYKVARSLATNECAVTATMLSLAVTLIGESVENSGLAEALVQRFPALQRLRFVPPPTPRRPGPWLPGKAPRADGGLWSWSGAAAQGNGVGAQSKVSPVDSSNAALLFDVEENILRRLRCYWGCLSVGSMIAVSTVALMSASGVRVWDTFAAFIDTEAEVKLAIASVTVWWIVYTCCEVVFVHLHHFPRALLWTALLYFAEACWVTDALLGAMVCAIGLHAAVVSIPLQFGLQLYVSAIEQVLLIDTIKSVPTWFHCGVLSITALRSLFMVARAS